MPSEREIPVFINSNLGSSAEVLADLLRRFDGYGSKLNKLSEGEVSKLFLFGGFERSSEIEVDFSHLELVQVGKQTRNFFCFGLRTLHQLSVMKIRPSLLISADLYYSFLSAFVVRLFSNPKHGIQVSFHGSFLNSNDGIFKSFVRRKYLGFVVSNCQSIRCVSLDLAEELSSYYNLSETQVVIAPIPVSLSNSPISRNRRKIISFVGRIHQERGLNQWVSIIRKLSHMRDDFSCLVIGDGVESEYFKEELSRILPRERLDFTGKLVRSEVLKNFDNLHILLSTAPTEGYGLAIREAMSAGVNVCAVRTAGLEALERSFPHLISTFQTESEGVAVLNAVLDNQVEVSEVLSFRRTLELENESNFVTLIKSWLN